MKFTFSLNLVIQIMSTAAHVLTLASSASFLSPDQKGAVVLAVGAIQSVSALLAHFKNPDGTPSSEPYKK